LQMNIYASPTDFATTDITCPTDFADDRAQVAMYASLTRVIEGAPVENKLAVFCLMARTAAADTALYRQQMVDDLWHLADDLGLVTLVGANNVQAAIAVAFDGGAR
jgi:hypothetical protein